MRPPRRRRGDADLAHRRDRSRRLPGAGRGAGGRAGDRFLADGEIVAFEGSRTSFERLQGRMGIGDPRLARLTGIPVFLYLFDLLELRRPRPHRPAAARAQARRCAERSTSTARSATRRTATSTARSSSARPARKGWEGLIAKRADSPYVHGRSGDWLKLKCSFEQELVIGGFTPPQGSRERFGALLVGYYEDGELRYAGKVGTGFSQRTLDDARRPAWKRCEVDDSPVHRAAPACPATARWVKPRAGRPVRLRRVDPRRQAAPPALPRPARRQAAARSRPRAAIGMKHQGHRTGRSAGAVVVACVRGFSLLFESGA